MTFIFVLLAVAVIALIGVLATGRLGELPEPVRDARPNERFGKPAFDVVARGYRMDEVDQVVEELQAQITKLSSRS
ncbi:MAG: hypothetical protein EXQ60_04340 [Candidatus Nanopelagicales bacterium]|nr:hypothetical protein [Candidatus Nanopelagicales bacterium]